MLLAVIFTTIIGTVARGLVPSLSADGLSNAEESTDAADIGDPLGREFQSHNN